MRRLVYYVAATLDGRIAGPDGGDPSGEDYFAITEDLLAFIVANYPETLPGPARDAMGIAGPGEHFDTILEGSGSFAVGLAAGIPDAYPHLRHVVYSNSLAAREDSDVEVVAGDPVAHVRELKAEEGLDLWLVGGGTLAHTLLPEIDRIVVKQQSSVIGSGVPMFNGPFAPHMFTPVDLVQLPGGVRVITLDRN
ncbi:dihydrofolate reductase family protein [Glycomyces paridis]|uniref:Dihydrofolate reductase n=1 Tax=Glycomyces paridis TaxID=2126555 RepID=A0A4S8PC75_9ACTN|nr:dihydrofolate reductase family protein [Glycomyces paridis]THV26752.1 dihydrofolate reductase [Glycomyces paridis]